MTTELQNKVWSILPKEFKEEVKKQYDIAIDSEQHYTLCTLEYLFGIHNITSDTEGEDEMLTVSRKRVQEMYADIINDIRDYNGENPEMVGTTDPILRERAAGMKAQLRRLFGSKCLPDEEQPKQKDCDNPLADQEGCRWRNNGKCAFDSACYFEPLNPQEPRPLPSENFCHVGPFRDLPNGVETAASTDPLSQNPSENCDNENRISANGDKPTTDCSSFDRLNIAAMAMQGLLSNTTRFSSYEISDLVRISLNCADALIAECEKKGGNNGED